MAKLIVSDFGEKDGVRVYRVNGEKADLEKIIDESYKMGHEFRHPPNIEYVWKGQYSVLLEIKVVVEVGASHDE